MQVAKQLGVVVGRISDTQPLEQIGPQSARCKSGKRPREDGAAPGPDNIKVPPRSAPGRIPSDLWSGALHMIVSTGYLGSAICIVLSGTRHAMMQRTVPLSVSR